MDGPVVLAGLCDEERTLRGDARDPSTVCSRRITSASGASGSRATGRRNQAHNIRFLPLHDIRDERYTVYFPVERAE